MILLKTSNEEINYIAAELGRWVTMYCGDWRWSSEYVIYPGPVASLIKEAYYPIVLSLDEIERIKRQVISVLSKDFLIRNESGIYHVRMKI